MYKNLRNILAGVNFITWKNSFQGVENHTCLRRETSSEYLNITLFGIQILWNLLNYKKAVFFVPNNLIIFEFEERFSKLS